MVRFLLEHDSNPLDLWFDDSPFEIALDRGYTEMEQLLTVGLGTAAYTEANATLWFVHRDLCLLYLFS